MEQQRQRRSRHSQRNEPKELPAKPELASKQLIFRRTAFLMFFCGFFMFTPLIKELWVLSVVLHDEHGGMAASQQTKNVSVSANRGNIYDSSGNVLAMSATVYKLILSPRDLESKINQRDYVFEEGENKGENDVLAYTQAIAERKQTLAFGIVQILPELSLESILERMEKTNSAYEVLVSEIEEETAELLRLFLAENNCGYDLWLAPDSKRYYPYSQLAAGILGFVNSNGGAYGVEAAYESYLQGTDGRIVTAKTGSQIEMYNSYSSFEDASNGYDVHLTLDATIQAYAEKTLAEGIEMFDIQNGGFCIIMDPNSGAVLGAASAPVYDLNQYATVIDPMLLTFVEEETAALIEQNKEDTSKTIEEITQEATSASLATARNTMWRSLTFQDTYEPGSTFKALVLAAALEEGLISESDTFYCSGSHTVADRTISCSKVTGHGYQTLAQAVENSCNPAFMEIGARMGVDLFYEYFEAFGLKNSTGLDLNGEYLGTIWPQSSMSIVDLAVASFGQRFTVNPLQMITGFAATINGGYLVEPYVVDSIQADNGTIVEKSSTTVVRQVVSQETSDITREILEGVVSNGSGINARVAGFSIGGKTGTSETLVDGIVTVSFMGFAPAEDPHVIVLLGFHSPNRAFPGSSYSTTGHYISGGNMPALLVGPLIADVLDYMGVQREYSEEELAMSDVIVPKVTDLNLSDGIEILASKNLNYRTIGEGSTITSQIPARNAVISGNSTVILYLGDAVPEVSSTVPNVYGLSYADAKSVLESSGFFLATSTYVNTFCTVEAQSLSPGEVAEMGTVVDVVFTTIDVEDGYLVG
ncbi:MAG: penicillin-binding transpeptidase domain-containing protein [Eubacteriales bacterium]